MAIPIGGLTIALQSLASTCMSLSHSLGIDSALLHRVDHPAGNESSQPGFSYAINLDTSAGLSMNASGATHPYVDNPIDIAHAGGPVTVALAIPATPTQWNRYSIKELS